ncbi:hypothetical protein [Arthrobacter sp. ISL-95]|uniref:hypothetical protein n=1 Tax=Arthrobacter sp. ISL-95 TaxID=2819116 RepID=UPI001BEBCA91|nr:hypothetical protein [Arthrobacter sp. ISL-95]MBT2587917.1 hypothetical protein [Arthrobacter sp. ISL-95]
MSIYKDIDIDLQDLVATIDTVREEYDLSNPDSFDGLDGRGILLSRLASLGWVTPTEARQAGFTAQAGLL